jgi:hypothetical protein
LTLEDLNSKVFSFFLDSPNFAHLEPVQQFHSFPERNTLALALLIEHQDRFLTQDYSTGCRHVLFDWIQGFNPQHPMFKEALQVAFSN